MLEPAPRFRTNVVAGNLTAVRSAYTTWTSGHPEVHLDTDDRSAQGHFEVFRLTWTETGADDMVIYVIDKRTNETLMFQAAQRPSAKIDREAGEDLYGVDPAVSMGYSEEDVDVADQYEWLAGARALNRDGVRTGSVATIDLPATGPVVGLVHVPKDNAGITNSSDLLIGVVGRDKDGDIEWARRVWG